MAPSVAESIPLPQSVTAVKWEYPRKPAPPPESPHYLLHACIASIQNGDPQLQSLNHHGAHLTCHGEDPIALTRKERVNSTYWALSGLFHNDSFTMWLLCGSDRGPSRNCGKHLCWRLSSEGPSQRLRARAAELADRGFSAFPFLFPGKNTQGKDLFTPRELTVGR